MTATLYGFKACNTVRDARAWLDKHGVEHTFHDYRVRPIDPAVIDDWFARAGWEKVFNRSSTAFRELPDADKTGIDEAKAKELMLKETNLIKRPVLDAGGELTFGFKPDAYAARFGKGG